MKSKFNGNYMAQSIDKKVLTAALAVLFFTAFTAAVTSADTITVCSSGCDHITIQAAGDASISGRVCEEDGVTPIEGATVKTGECDIMPFEFVCESTTDANGIYIITNLSAGDYRVYAYAPEYGREFYNGTHFRNDAQPVSVIEGGETPNINFSLGPGGSISGTIASADSGMLLSNVS
jgi:hypothetical protein